MECLLPFHWFVQCFGKYDGWEPMLLQLMDTGMVNEKGAALTFPSGLMVVTMIVGRGASTR
jgi:hypothetical protein